MLVNLSFQTKTVFRIHVHCVFPVGFELGPAYADIVHIVLRTRR